MKNQNKERHRVDYLWSHPAISSGLSSHHLCQWLFSCQTKIREFDGFMVCCQEQVLWRKNKTKEINQACQLDNSLY